jgi:LPXTG-motif cell wall-anchored protein
MISVGPQATQPVKFIVSRSQPGTYSVDIGGQKGSFTINGVGGTSGRPVTGSMVVLITLVGLILVAAIVLMISFRRSA